MDGFELDEAVRMLRASQALGLGIQSVLAMLPEEYREIIFEKYSLENQEIIRTPATVLQNKARRSWKHKSSDVLFCRNLKQYLNDHVGRSEAEVDSLDQSTDKILELLADPLEAGDKLMPVKGLVIGYVQSGKTANYTALAAKAFDSGYRVIIVLSGIHRSLRRQTQIRMNDELGIASVGSGRISARNFPPYSTETITAMTSEDLLSGDSQYSGVSNVQGNLLFVVKKNTAVLERLITWIQSSELQSAPTLIIDDEADQASINTGGNRSTPQNQVDTEQNSIEVEDLNPDEPEEPPAVINSKVRRLVNLFRNASYVGYTATPYANVFIDHEANDTQAGEDLYPKDFIVSLPKPNSYFGPEELFEESPWEDPADQPLTLANKVVEIVPPEQVFDLHELLTDSNTNADNHKELPDSLKEAISYFVLAVAALTSVRGPHHATAMLIHTSSSKKVQNVLSLLVEKYVRALQKEWRYDNEFARPIWQNLWEKFSARFASGDFPTEFTSVLEALDEVLANFSSIAVLTLNSDSDDELDYQYRPHGASIVIGGNKLSRGLTIEGLLISYFVRRSSEPKADTLTQMGRFFGHRKANIDLSRIYTTAELKISFQEIALVEGSLREEIRRYEKLGLRPIDFGPRVKKSSKLLPTARARMGEASHYGVSYSGELVQTSSFPNDLKSVSLLDGGIVSPLQRNLEATKNFLAACGAPEGDDLGGHLSKAKWRNVNAALVLDYLRQYSGVDDATRFVPGQISAYIEDVLKHQPNPELTNWTVVVLGREASPELGTEDFGGTWSVGRIARALDKGSESSIGTLVTPLGIRRNSNGVMARGDELQDLDQSETTALAQSASSLDEFRRLVRATRPSDSGLLLIYPISPDSLGTSEGKNQSHSLGQGLFKSSPPCTVIGLALVFPSSAIQVSSYWQGSAGRSDV